MGQSVELSIRQQLVIKRQSGSSYTSLSAEFKLGYNTVREICRRHRCEGDLGLVPRTNRCGRRVNADSERSFRFVRLIAHLHPNWGVPYLLTRLALKYPDVVFQSIRHYQRRLNRVKDKPPKAIVPRLQPPDRARLPHDVWQIDAKERLAFPSNPSKEACFLNVTDEKTGALLQASAFPPGAD